MTLAEKLRYLREVEGSLRGLSRPMTQQELVRAIRKEQGKSISQSYVSQIEGGVRPHMTQSTRTLLAKFFKVHPGFLVDDPEGYHTELVSDLRTTEGKLDVWLLQGSERFASDPQLSEVLIKAAREKDTRRCFLLLGAVLDTPGLADRLLEALEARAGGESLREPSRKAAYMTWADFYLICFAVGFSFSLLSFLAGGLRWHLHLPHFSHIHVAPHVHAAPARLPLVIRQPRQPMEMRCAHSHTGNISPFNFITLTAFLAWFGGAGYLLTRYSSIWFVSGSDSPYSAGLVGGGIVFLFLSRVLISREEIMDPADYEMAGVLGRVSVTIRENGTGEIIYSQAGTRRTCGARSEDGNAIAKGTEVIVTRYEKGIAYVRLWSEISGEFNVGASVHARARSARTQQWWFGVKLSGRVQMDSKLYRALTAILWLALPLTGLQYWSVWNQLPARMATHFGVSGQPNGWMPRETSLIFSLGCDVPVAGGVYLGAHPGTQAGRPRLVLAGHAVPGHRRLVQHQCGLLNYNISGRPLNIVPALVVLFIAAIAVMVVALITKRGAELPRHSDVVAG